MSWEDNLHTRSEEEAKELQSIENQKILDSKFFNGDIFKKLESERCLFNKIHTVEVGFLTKEYRLSKLGYDSYTLAGKKRVSGYVIKFYSISPSVRKKYLLSNIEMPRLFLDVPTERNDRIFLDGLNIDKSYYRFSERYSYVNSIDFPSTVSVTFEKAPKRPSLRKIFEETGMANELCFVLETVGLVDNQDILEIYCLASKIE